MGTSLFFVGERTPLRASLPLAAATRAEREEFFGTRTPQGGFSCRFAAIHLLSRQKTIKIYFASADAKVCDAGACFLPVRAENAAGARWEIVRGFRVRRACSLPEAANAAREGFCLFAAEGGKCGGKNYS